MFKWTHPSHYRLYMLVGSFIPCTESRGYSMSFISKTCMVFWLPALYIFSASFSLSLSFIVYCVISNISIFIFLYKNTFQLRKQNLPRMETVIKFHAGPLACSLVIYSCLPRLKHIQTNRTFFSSSSWIPLPIKKN